MPDGGAAVAPIQARTKSIAAPNAILDAIFGGQSTWQEWDVPRVAPIIGQHVAVSTRDDLLLLATDRVRRPTRQDFMRPDADGQVVVDDDLRLIKRSLAVAVAECHDQQ